MKVVILAGGYGTRISEESSIKPKPMVEIGDKPILWHIMKIYSACGVNEFIICLGYKGYIIKEYFSNYILHVSDITLDIQQNQMDIHQSGAEPWKITLIDTGDGTMTGGRIRRVKKYIGDETFCLTYGDGVANINVEQLISFHRRQKTLATMTAVQPPGRFGAFNLKGRTNVVSHFREKPEGDGAWINGGFFVLEPEVIDYIADDNTVWERDPLEKLAKMGQLSAYRHEGFWQPMDTLRDKHVLDELWGRSDAPWKVW